MTKFRGIASFRAKALSDFARNRGSRRDTRSERMGRTEDRRFAMTPILCQVAPLCQVVMNVSAIFTSPKYASPGEFREYESPSMM